MPITTTTQEDLLVGLGAVALFTLAEVKGVESGLKKNKEKKKQMNKEKVFSYINYTEIIVIKILLQRKGTPVTTAVGAMLGVDVFTGVVVASV